MFSTECKAYSPSCCLARRHASQVRQVHFFGQFFARRLVLTSGRSFRTATVDVGRGERRGAPPLTPSLPRSIAFAHIFAGQDTSACLGPPERKSTNLVCTPAESRSVAGYAPLNFVSPSDNRECTLSCKGNYKQEWPTPSLSGLLPRLCSPLSFVNLAVSEFLLRNAHPWPTASSRNRTEPLPWSLDSIRYMYPVTRSSGVPEPRTARNTNVIP